MYRKGFFMNKEDQQQAKEGTFTDYARKLERFELLGAEIEKAAKQLEMVALALRKNPANAVIEPSPLDYTKIQSLIEDWKVSRAETQDAAQLASNMGFSRFIK